MGFRPIKLTPKFLNSILFGKTTAPADGDLSNSEAGFWIDNADGNPKIKAKIKDTDGTVFSQIVSENVAIISKRKSATESVTSSTTTQADDEMFFPIGANETWTAEFYLIMDGGLNAAGGDGKLIIIGPSGSTMQGYVIGPQLTESTDLGTIALRYMGRIVGPVPIGLNGTANPVLVQIYATFVNGATAGNVELYWAQNVSHATASRILLGSYFAARRVQ